MSTITTNREIIEAMGDPQWRDWATNILINYADAAADRAIADAKVQQLQKICDELRLAREEASAAAAVPARKFLVP